MSEWKSDPYSTVRVCLVSHESVLNQLETVKYHASIGHHLVRHMTRTDVSGQKQAARALLAS